MSTGLKTKTALGLGNLDAKVQMQNTADLISSLKKVFSNTELKVVTECLKKIKEAKDGARNISTALKQLKLAMFRDQKRPRETDAKFDDKHECILKL